ncbi:GNAT family N-acetyltransferase [Streptomyces sp. F63]|uniref:GNAT family N-acetyltransferase n=1 Tax=Streptomyces sp. F63 TaxID=2824887 RepID=UPI001B370BB9|nr:GNAT family N-acetyltransferase [Streptomyces sp. F63]MBQ0985161.1 GNAT family N-acetyltransferase [Streptomyces sp. F63]
MSHDHRFAPGGTPLPRIRPRAGADLGPCARLLAEIHACDGYPVNWPEEPTRWLTPSALLTAWVAELDGHVAGHAVLSRSGPDDAAPAVWSGRAGRDISATAVVSRLFVAPAARGRGVGALLLGRAAEEARARGLHPVLDVLASDTRAVALYERQGWRFLAAVRQRWSPDTTVTVRCYAAPPPGPAAGPAAGDPREGHGPAPLRRP